ncbi:MAG: DUF1223 domain-containing protein [Pseudomonadota bacterium]
MRAVVAFLLVVWIAGLTSAARAGDAVVVELFTSQGCSSCPPADKLLGELAQRDDVIALALHVDYWDYIGWKDTFADPAYTQRQRGYAAAAGHRRIYTPQMVIGGVDHVIGYRPMDVADTIQRHRSTNPVVDVRASIDGGTVTILADASQEGTGPYLVQLVSFTAAQTVDVRRGENAGRALTYHNIVSGWTEVGQWNGSGRFTARAPVESGQSYAVLVQSVDHGAIAGAVRAR